MISKDFSTSVGESFFLSSEGGCTVRKYQLWRKIQKTLDKWEVWCYDIPWLAEANLFLRSAS